MLGKAGHKVWVALSGAEGIQRLEKENFDLVFVDYYIGDMNAVDFMHAAAPTCPVILVSGDPHHSELFFDTIEKPYSSEELFAVLRRVLQ